MKSRTLLITSALTSLLLVSTVTFAQEYQAEDATLSPDFQVANNHSGYSGTGFVDYVGEGYVEWTVSVPTSGRYMLKFRYALASGNRPLDILINGSLTSPNLAFPASGSWDKWVSANTEVTLYSGTSTVTAQTRGSSGANVDRLDVSAFTSPTTRFIDNGDGTITDTDTNLMWEKKLSMDNEKCASTTPLDWDLRCVEYSFTLQKHEGNYSYVYPDGTAYTQFLATLNQQLLPLGSENYAEAECFAKHCDWRIPTLSELRTILVYPCSASPCIDPIFGPTIPPSYVADERMATYGTSTFYDPNGVNGIVFNWPTNASVPVWGDDADAWESNAFLLRAVRTLR